MPLIYVSDADLQRLTRLVAQEITWHQEDAHQSKTYGRYWRDIDVPEGFRQECDWRAADNFKEAKEHTRKQNKWSALQRNLKNPKRGMDEFYESLQYLD